MLPIFEAIKFAIFVVCFRCAAAVGYHNFGPLDLFLGGPTCQTRGTIQHEFLHTLGFWHEHTRQDRDKHVTINWDNISRGKLAKPLFKGGG